jgi:hypothetical protein
MADPRNPKPEKDWWKTNAPITNSIANFLATPFISSYNQVFNPKPVDPKLQGFTRWNEQLKYDQGQFAREGLRPQLDFVNTVGNFLTSQPQPAPGQGLGSRMFPANPARPTATGQGQPGGWSTSYGSAAQAGRTAMNQGIPNPPGGIPTTRPGGPQGAPRGFTADDLYIDPTPVFQPVLDQYAQQQAQLQDRYGTNQADIKNIFGNLTTVRALDKTKIAQQYQTSIQQQQDALAARTAEARMGVQQGQQGAATAAGEMGTAGQPAPTSSLTAQAAEEGIADSNAYQTTWAALQSVMSQQAQNDVQNAVQGYDYQQTSALEQLRNNLEDRLAAIQGNVAGTQSQLAQARLSGQQTVANAKYGEEQQRQENAANMAAAQARASAPKETSYSKDVYGWRNRVTDAGKDTTGIINSINQAATAELRAMKARGVQNPKLTKAALQNRWLVMFQGDPSTEFAIDYIKNYSGYGS